MSFGTWHLTHAEPEPPSRVIPPEDGQEGSQELQNPPGAMNLSTEQVRKWKQVEETRVGVAAGGMGRFDRGHSGAGGFSKVLCL